jgi:hypothetical protein
MHEPRSIKISCRPVRPSCQKVICVISHKSLFLWCIGRATARSRITNSRAITEIESVAEFSRWAIRVAGTRDITAAITTSGATVGIDLVEVGVAEAVAGTASLASGSTIGLCWIALRVGTDDKCCGCSDRCGCLA